MYQHLIDTLISLEPVFVRAGNLAVVMRAGTHAQKKLETGVSEVDLVTEADVAVQEVVLAEMKGTPLVECELFAEEKTASTACFTGKNGLRLTLDPIDGTHSYVDGGQFFSIIVGLHGPADVFYTFCYYPVSGWGFRVASGVVTEFGRRPVPTLRAVDRDLQKTIAYTYGEPEKMMPELYQRLVAEGFVFAQRKAISDDAGSATLFYLDQVAGYYIGNPIVYDGLPALHYARSRGWTTDSSVDLSKVKEGKMGPHYSGYYLVLKK